MRYLFFIFLSLFVFSNRVLSQLSAEDKVVLQIPIQETYSTGGISSFIKSRYSSDSDRVRAIFVWVANNISYDIEKLLLRQASIRPTVNDVLKTRKALCQGYAELFVALCNECDIKAILIPGYTKQPNGIIGELSHAWVAAELDNKWFLFDPTWSAGTVNNNQYTPRFSNHFYKVLPEEMIKDHMPFDPMYQFLNYPLLYEEFNKGTSVSNSGKPYFNYADSINAYNKLDTFNQFISLGNRINRNGEKNRQVNELLEILNKNKVIGLSKAGFEGAIVEFNQATKLFNQYISHKNSRFSSIKNNKEIQQIMDDVLAHIGSAFSIAKSVVADNDQNKRSLQDFNAALTKFYNSAKEESIFLKKYLQTRATSAR